MTIKQQGGVFGRNPTFNQVDADTSLTDVLYVGGTTSLLAGSVAYFDNNVEIKTNRSIKWGDGDAKISGLSSGLIYQDADDTVFRSSNTASTFARINSNGLLFNGDTAAANALDDYEEGTWTPTLVAYGGTPTVSGYYVKIGQMVYVECSIALDGTSDASNYIIDGLPFTMSSPYLGGGAVNTNDGGVADVLVGSAIGTGRLRLYDSSGTSQTYNSIGVSSTVTLNAHYRAA